MLLSIVYTELKEFDIELFSSFDRYQEVKQCWRKENDKWILKDIAFFEQWSIQDYKALINDLKNTVNTGGAVFGALYNNTLAGFSSLENELFGQNKQYIQLSSLHVSFEKRGLGIGKKLFYISCKRAKELGATKLYISAHSSKETQAFYDRLGCVEAEEYNQKLVLKEPYDAQLEYDLYKQDKMQQVLEI